MARPNIVANKTQTKDAKSNLIKIKNDLRQRLIQFENKMGDVTLCSIDGTTIPAHRLVLSISSSYFESMFASGMKEASDEVIKINGVCGTILKSLVHYSYTEEIELDVNNVQELAEASLLLQFDTVCNYCGKVMGQNMSVFNCCGLAIFAEQHNLNSLLELSTDFLLTNFDLVYKQPEFNEITFTFLANILGKDELIIESETSIFYAIQKWFLHDPEGRNAHLMELLKFIRFSNLDAKFTGTDLFDFCMKYKCDQLLALAVVIQQKSPDRNGHQLDSRKSCRAIKKSVSEEVIAISSSNVFHYYSLEKNEWTYLHKRFDLLHPKDKIIRTALNNTEIIFVCTSNKRTVVKSLDLITGEERSHAIFLKPYDGARSLIYNNAVFILFNKSFIRYDLEKCNWINLPGTTVSRRRHSIVIFKNHLYVLGGEETSTVERYDFSRNRWETCSNLTQKRYDSVATVIGNYIYVIGGNFIERYDPNGTSSLISTLTPLSSVTSVTAIKNEIYLSGSDDQCQRHVVRYNPIYDLWNDVSRIKEAELPIRLMKCNFPISTLLLG